MMHRPSRPPCSLSFANLIVVGLAVFFVCFSFSRILKHNGFPTTFWKSDVQRMVAEAEFISGPLVADTGQLCVFRLSDPQTRADWVIVPEATSFIDSSGSSFAFSSNISARYTIIAAVVTDGVPKILTHIIDYGGEATPRPSPTPSPTPNPPPINSLKDWVTQNVPDAGIQDSAALASCYASAARDIESGAIVSQEAAFAAIRMATQTKIDMETWASFLDELAMRVSEKLAGNKDVKILGDMLRDISDGLNAAKQ